MRYVDYDALPRPPGESLPLAWDVWGVGDQLGMLNNIDEDVAIAAAGLVRRGVRFNLDLPLHVPLGELPEGSHRFRKGPDHRIEASHHVGLCIRDDCVTIYPQASSQWDGLTHVGDPVHGFYNHVQAEQITGKQDTRNGVEHLAEFGIVTRAVLADLPRFFDAMGQVWNPVGSQVCDAQTLQACLDHQQVSLRKGDVLLVRTGWTAAYRAADAEGKIRVFQGRDYSGVSGGEDMWRFLWDNRVAAIASDTVTVEVWPIYEGKPSLHLAIARLGLTLGEMFDLEALADDSAATGEWASLFVSKPLNLRGGVGSPPNALAVR
ncbi:cyclase family protein [Leptospira interrogans]